MSSVLVVGQERSTLVHHLVQRLDASMLVFSIDRFADAEMLVTFSSPEPIDHDIVLVVFQFVFGAMPEAKKLSVNDQILGLLQMLDALRTRGARAIRLVLPYLPYARQERAVFMLGRCLKALGVQEIVVCDMHDAMICPMFPIPLHNFSTAALWTDLIQKNIIKDAGGNVCVGSPDQGGRARAQALAALLAVPCVYAKKNRVAPDKAVAYELIGDVRGKTVFLVDDIIDTGNTAASACAMLKDEGALRIYGFFTHAVFSNDQQLQRIQGCFEKIFVTDSVFNTLVERPASMIQKISLNPFLSRFNNGKTDDER